MGGWGKGSGRAVKGYGKSNNRRLGVISSIGKLKRSANQGFGGGRPAKGGGKGKRSDLGFGKSGSPKGGSKGKRNQAEFGFRKPLGQKAKGYGKNGRAGRAPDVVATFGRKGKGKSARQPPAREYGGGTFGFASGKGKSPKGYGRTSKGKGKRQGGYSDNGVLALPARGYGKGKGKAGKGKAKRTWGVVATIGKTTGLGGRRVKGKGKGKSTKGGGRVKGKGKGRKGKGKGKGKRGDRVSKESLDKQLEEYMGPEAIKAVLDEELDNYFGTTKKVADGNGEAAKGTAEASPRAADSA